MKIYKTQAEVEKDIRNDVLVIEGDVRFECSIFIDASIVVNVGDITARDITARDITARDINARDIKAWNINAGNINAGNINAWDINARDITARDITAGNINAGNINAGNINAWDINARNILYYAFCCVYQSIKCLSIKAKRVKYQEPVCLEGFLEINKKESKKIKIRLAEGQIVEGEVVE